MSDSPLESPPREGRTRLRWVAPLFVGISLGAVIGIIITFAALRSRGSSPMVVTNFDMRRVLTQTTSEQFTLQESSVNIGSDSYNPVDGGTSIRRRYEINGVIRNPAEASTFASTLKSQIEAELMRHGAYTSGGGSSSSSSNDRCRFVGETGFYRGTNRGQVDIVFQSIDRQVNVVILIHEGR